PKPLVDLPEGGEDLKPDEPVGLPQAGDDETYEEDFTDVEDGFPVAEEGSHHAKVIDFEKSDSKTGNPQYVWQFRITAGNSKDIEIRYWTSLLPQARWKAVETLVAVGVKAAGSIAKFTKDDIIGKPCILEVIHDVYEGRDTHKVKKVHPPTKDSIDFAKADKVPF
ncbi:MAG: DUF669 domain-containing protein, partial [Desulfobacteraceae bacterium]|nr:DUF669 domain-containing protein [Desulfobacteraceae bacterium]